MSPIRRPPTLLTLTLRLHLYIYCGPSVPLVHPSSSFSYLAYTTGKKHASAQVLWVFAVASPDGRAFLQLFLDLDLLLFCVRGSSIRGEIRFNTPDHLVCGGVRVWHHVVLTHARPKSRILGTRDKLSLWVDGELADTVKVRVYSTLIKRGRL